MDENLKFVLGEVERMQNKQSEALYQTECDIQAESEDTLCGKPHDGGENEPENCAECMAIKMNI